MFPYEAMKWARAALRSPFSCSEAATSASKPTSGLPLSSRRNSSSSLLASPVRVWSRSVTTSAPALMNGLRGMPFSYSSCTSELNGLPDGSRPTRSHRLSPPSASARARANTLVMDCAENGTRQSPTPKTFPSRSAIAIPNCAGSTVASAGMYSAGVPLPTSGAMSASIRSSSRW